MSVQELFLLLNANNSAIEQYASGNYLQGTRQIRLALSKLHGGLDNLVATAQHANSIPSGMGIFAHDLRTLQHLEKHFLGFYPSAYMLLDYATAFPSQGLLNSKIAFTISVLFYNLGLGLQILAYDPKTSSSYLLEKARQFYQLCIASIPETSGSQSQLDALQASAALNLGSIHAFCWEPQKFATCLQLVARLVDQDQAIADFSEETRQIQKTVIAAKLIDWSFAPAA